MKKTAKKKAAVITREIEVGPRKYVTRRALETMGTREIKGLMRERGVPIPKLRSEMLDRLTQHFDEAGTKVTVRIG
jgi:hypothetical protein